MDTFWTRSVVRTLEFFGKRVLSPLKQTQRTAHTAWCPSEAGASLLALGSASVGTSVSDATLDFVSFDAGRMA
eukprot:Skav219469  [mRNA]  locus=scaffold2809:24786:27947:+ [translate_table: standard]